jgi:phage gp37-like protein
MRELIIRALEITFFVVVTPPAIYVLWKGHHDRA